MKSITLQFRHAATGVKESATEQVRERDPAETAGRPRVGPGGGGRLRLIALIEEAAVIGRILRHLGVPTEIPVPCPARAPPPRVGAPDQAGWDDDTSVFTPCS